MVVVGLGCETVQSDVVAAAVEEHRLPIRGLTVQGARGTDACVDRGTAAVADLRKSATAQEADGATATVDEQTTALGDLMAGVAVDDLTGSAKRHTNRLFNAADYPARVTHIGAEAVARGFDATTGFLGNTPITRVVAYGRRIGRTGTIGAVTDAMTLLNMSSRVKKAVAGLTTADAHLVLHVVRQGTPANHLIVPMMKLSGDVDMLAAIPNGIDLDTRETGADGPEAYLPAVTDGDRMCARQRGLTKFSVACADPLT